MPIEIPKILETIPLAEYHPDFGGRLVRVWVNPPRQVLNERLHILNENSEFIMRPDSVPSEDVLAQFETRLKKLDEARTRLYAWLSVIPS